MFFIERFINCYKTVLSSQNGKSFIFILINNSLITILLSSHRHTNKRKTNIIQQERNKKKNHFPHLSFIFINLKISSI
jgi:hypothetical protein